MSDGGGGYIRGAERLLEKTRRLANNSAAQPKNVREIVGEARAGDVLRGRGFSELEYPDPIDGVQVDLLATDSTGIRRIVEVKDGSRIPDDEQILRYKQIAQQTGRRFTVMTMERLSRGQLEKLKRVGVDVLDPSGELVN
ncbi:hypothetical protein [Meiothermus sp.]|uniref:hypothetical protein n=1 Tax=Meiothermus sp. TaxID=1955249 RepID=UPI00262E4C5F|nr:hypothetical protein [Meiothermus sp.]